MTSVWLAERRPLAPTGLMDVGVGSFVVASGIVAGSKGLLVSRASSVPHQDRDASAVPHIVALTILGAPAGMLGACI